MKDIYFNQLEVGDSVWIVYDKNYDKRNSISEYVLVEGHIIKNHKVTREIDRSDMYEESNYVTYIEDWIVISVNGLSNQYSRYYSQTYNEKGQMSMSPAYNDHGPYIEVFVTKDKAKNYLISWCNYLIECNQKKINDLKEEIKVYQQSINNIK